MVDICSGQRQWAWRTEGRNEITIALLAQELLQSWLFELFLFHGALELRILAAVCIRKCIFGWQDLPILFREGRLAPMKREGNCPIVHFRVSFAEIALGQVQGHGYKGCIAMRGPFSILHISDLHQLANEPISNDELISALIQDRDQYMQEKCEPVFCWLGS